MTDFLVTYDNGDNSSDLYDHFEKLITEEKAVRLGGSCYLLRDNRTGDELFKYYWKTFEFSKKNPKHKLWVHKIASFEFWGRNGGGPYITTPTTISTKMLEALWHPAVDRNLSS